VQFARAYAKLNPPATLQVIDETGAVETEEMFEDALHDRMQATPPAKPRLVKAV
jgi:hypothetical protein